MGLSATVEAVDAGQSSAFEVEDSSAIFAACDLFFRLHGDNRGRDELHVTSLAFAILEWCQGHAIFRFHESFVEWHEIIWCMIRSVFTLGSGFVEFGVDTLRAFGDRLDVFIDECLGFGQCGFCLGLDIPQAVNFLHGFELERFELVEIFFVAGDFVRDGLKLFVFPRFELLLFESDDGGSARLCVHFVFFDDEFRGEKGIVCLFQIGLVSCQF